MCRVQSDSVQSLAAVITSGSANFGYVPASVNSGLPLPRRECPTCDGTVCWRCWCIYIRFFANVCFIIQLAEFLLTPDNF